MPIDRRFFLLSAAATALPLSAAADQNPFAALEAKTGGRLGIAALDTATGNRIAYRANERFPMCSTFKLLAVGAILHRVDTGDERLDRWIGFGQSDVLDGSPVARVYVSKGGMVLGKLCAAAMSYSDNTAGNLLIAALGGPAGVTAYARSLGDTVTRLDRNEPSLNSATPGDPRDTTSPAAMLADLNALTQGTALTGTSQALLNNWLNSCQTAGARIPAGLPNGWNSGNKTGTGANGTTNDVAIINPPGLAPMLVSAYYTGSTASSDDRDAVLADVGTIIAQQFQHA